ncbi:MAG: PEP-CTERM sorting domain-containing protein [Phycisphaerae bacterium]|nr:PEP-CTERM sorting domain-containing protein [Phycisphaerae bacterium]
MSRKEFERMGESPDVLAVQKRNGKEQTMKKLTVILALAALVGLVATPASAELIYDTGFETTDGFSDGTSVNGIDGWTQEHVITETEDTNAISGTLSLELQHSTSDAMCYNAFTNANYDVVTAEWKVKKLNANTATGDLAWYFMDGGGNGDRATTVCFDETTDGVYSLTAVNGSGTNLNKTGLVADTVYTIRMEANYATDKYNVYLDGERVATNFGFRNVTGQINRLRMFSNDHNDRGVVDNVRIWNTVRETGFGTIDGFTDGGSIDDVGGWNSYSGVCTTVASGIDGMSLNVQETAGGTTGRAELRFVETTDVVVECKVKVLEDSTGDTYVQLLDGGRDGIEAVRLQFDGSASPTIVAWDGSSAGTDTLAFSEGTTYGVKVVLNDAANTFDLYIDSGLGYALLADDYDLFDASAGNLDTFVFVRSDGATAYSSQMDDLSIVPEPATMTLLLLGLPFALRRRKRA